MIKSKLLLYCSIFIFYTGFTVCAQEVAKKDAQEVAKERTAIETAAVTTNTDLAQQAMGNPLYRVLPGDIYKLGYTIGQTAVEYPIAVDSSGSIRVSNLGSVSTTGKTFVAVKKQVEALISQNYPLSAVQFVLVSPSNFMVTVKGEVIQTTEVKAWGLMRVSHAISGLLTQFSSQRYFSITSAAGKTTEYDLFRAIRGGDMSHDPYLSPGDVITIPRAVRQVMLSGAVERPGTYELSQQDTLMDLIKVYGNGYTIGADTVQVKINRIRENEAARSEAFFVKLDTSDTFQLQHLDAVHVENKKELQPVIYLELPFKQTDHTGIALEAIQTPITLPFAEGDDLVSLVRQKLFLFTDPLIDGAAAYIFRDGRQIPVNLNRILFDASYTEMIPLKPNDRFIVPEIKQTVSVSGAVIRPNAYPYSPGRKVDYYIALAGGFDTSKNSGGSVLIQDVYGNKLSKNDIIGPNTIITAQSNAFMYNFNRYAPLITVTATVVTAVIAVLTFALKK